ncbi:MAG: DUF1638 domain-containing protein [Syntrophobacteraceae bacterium]
MRVVIACRVMQAELDEMRAGCPGIEIIYLDQALHRTPDKMPGLIQEQICKVSGYADRIILGYGLCSKGVVGLRAEKQELIVPKAHDCIAFLLGSCAAYDSCFAERPGTHYLSRGWLAEKKDPLGVTEGEYTDRVGRENAIWVMEEELKHYTHITLIKSGGIEAGLVERARRNAEFFGKQYGEITGSMDYFAKIVHGPYNPADFFVIPPGMDIKQELWFPG